MSAFGPVEIGETHDHPLDGARGVRRHDQVFLLLAILPFARMRIARMRLRHARCARHAVAVDAGGQDQPFHRTSFAASNVVRISTGCRLWEG